LTVTRKMTTLFTSLHIVHTIRSVAVKMILARLSEPSTYAGVAAMLASLGVMGFNEGQWTMLFGAAAAVAAAVAMVLREKG